MNKKLIKFLMLMAYCIPYGYLAMNGDATSGTMIFYGFMIIGFGTLCRTAIKTHNTIILIIGNILSFISSYLFTLRNLPEEWGWYFKPFTPGWSFSTNNNYFFHNTNCIYNYSKDKKS